ncbi:MAG: cytochrome c oxidase assembly protein [Acidimicrobiales bacterium]
MVVLAALLGVVYAIGVRRLARRDRHWPHRRTAAALGAAIAMSIAGLASDSTFFAHMVEHLLLGMVAPLLLALAAPVTLMLQAGGPRTTRIVRRALHWRPLVALTHPIVGLALFGASLVALYLSPLLEATQRDGALHVAVHVHLVVVGSLLVMPLVGVDPIPRRTPFGARLLTVLVAVPFHAFLAVALLSAREPVAPDAYPDLADQRRAAALLWASGELFTLAVAAIVFRAWLVAERREAARHDRRLDHALPAREAVSPES